MYLLLKKIYKEYLNNQTLHHNMMIIIKKMTFQVQMDLDQN